MSVRVHYEIEKRETIRPFGSSCYICSKGFLIGDIYCVASLTTFVRGAKVLTWGRVHYGCTAVGKNDLALKKRVS